MDLHAEKNGPVKLRPPKLPDTVDKLLPLRHLKHKRSLNDIVEDIVIALWENAEFQAFLEAVYDEDAVEGSLAADNLEAAAMIRNYASENDYPEIANKKKATISKVLGVVMRRYNRDRNRRRNTVKGQFVPPVNNTTSTD